MGLPVFCRGVTPNSCVRSGPGTVGLPITAGGVPVATGDLILGDADGVVVVSQARLAEVGSLLAAVRAAEQAAEAKVRAGATTMPDISELLDSDGVRWVD